MVSVGVREKQGAGCLLGNDLIAPGLVPGPEAFMAWTTSAVLTRAQATLQSLEETRTIPDLQEPEKSSLPERADFGKAMAVEIISPALEGEEDEATEANHVLESGSLPKL